MVTAPPFAPLTPALLSAYSRLCRRQPSTDCVVGLESDCVSGYVRLWSSLQVSAPTVGAGPHTFHEKRRQKAIGGLTIPLLFFSMRECLTNFRNPSFILFPSVTFFDSGTLPDTGVAPRQDSKHHAEWMAQVTKAIEESPRDDEWVLLSYGATPLGDQSRV